MTTQQKLIKSTMGLLDMASYLHNVSEACRVVGCNRDTFYRAGGLMMMAASRP